MDANTHLHTDAPTGTASGVVLRPAAPADLDTVAAIYAHYVLHTVTTFEETPRSAAEWEERRRELAEAGLPFLVAEVSGDVARYAYATAWRPRPAYRFTVENSIYLAPGATGKGLGSALLGALIEAAAGAGKRRMIAVVADSDAAAASLALHRRFGFTDAGRLTAVGHKHDRWIDTVLLEKELGGG
ncbi:GNAT family N-acetyltransferase [Streptomyces sp. GKU 895]|nr:GNAT family N-acetyltransferase [Streptomyces sp. GKU 895]